MLLNKQDYQNFFKFIFGDKNYLEDSLGKTTIYYPQAYKSILEKEEFKRMGKILQQGASVLVHPRVIDTRLEHSIGTYEKMLRILVKLCQKTEIKEYIMANNYQEYVSALLLRALLHDIGHSALSHSFEIMCGWKKGEHEKVGDLLLSSILQEGNMTETIKNSKEMNFLGLNSILEGEIDVDRMDFTARDDFYLGLYHNGEMEETVNQIIDSIDIMCVGENATGEKEFKVFFPEEQANHIDKVLMNRQRNYKNLPFGAKAKAADFVLRAFGERLVATDEEYDLKKFIQKYKGKNVDESLDLAALIQMVDVRFFEGIAEVILTTKDEELRTLALMCIPSIKLRENLRKLEDKRKGETLSVVDEVHKKYPQFGENPNKNIFFEENCAILSLRLKNNVDLVYKLIGKQIQQYLEKNNEPENLNEQDLQKLGIYYLEYPIFTYESKKGQEIWIKRKDGTMVEYNKIKTKNGEKELNSTILFAVKPVIERVLNKQQAEGIITYIKEVSETKFRRKQFKQGAIDIEWETK